MPDCRRSSTRILDEVGFHLEGFVKYAIYPPVGIARLGNSPAEFFIAPERRNSRGVEIVADAEQEITSFKDASFRVKRQVARFHLFEVPDDGSAPRPAQLPAGSAVTWSVRLVNKKDAVARPVEPPPTPVRPIVQPARTDRVVDSGIQQISAQSTTAVALAGQYRGHSVPLGELRCDTAGRLLVFGGPGKSESPTGAPIGPDFYNNPDWHDDTGDGPVTANITLPDGSHPECAPAWIAVAPPDFAPGCPGIVTLYDVLVQVAVDHGSMTLPARPTFADDIRPMLERARNLQWVNNGATWPLISDDWAALANPGAASQALRADNAGFVLAAEDQLTDFELRAWQKNYLNQWAAGTFDPGPRPGTPAAELTRAALDCTVGQGFFPGIEAGIIVTDPTIYSSPFDFRVDHAALSAGDLTALMALPWQADFLKCNSAWWPSQRPDVAPQSNGARPAWLRPSMKHLRFSQEVLRLGVITPKTNAAGETVMVEEGRDPQLQ